MIVMPHWSATRFMLWDQCPGMFKERYVDGVAIEPTEALCFGKAMHMGLEAHFNGADGEHAFRAAWKTMIQAELIPAGIQPSRSLTGMGLQLLEQVYALGLHGVPERGFSIDTNAELGAPIIGAIDLYDPDSNVVFDFKTTRGRWSQERAQAEVWQPHLYALAVWDEAGDLPDFEYLVLNRVDGTLSRFRRQCPADEWLRQMNVLWRRMCEVSVATAQGRFECHSRHGLCPECGERWSHEHVCDIPHPDRDRPRLRVAGGRR